MTSPDRKRYAFAGNRAFVLDRMLALGLDVVRIWAVEGSYLQRKLDLGGGHYSVIKDGPSLIKDIDDAEFDLFVGNGLPIILPISKLQRNGRRFVNIHPSVLPSLRGRDPVPGALLFGRMSGATCHVMDDGIDTGAVISQIEIPNTPDLDAGLLYQLSFKAEAEAFERAYSLGFEPQGSRCGIEGSYYSFSPDDLQIDLNEPAEQTLRRVSAFCTGNKGAELRIGGEIFKVWNADMIVNPYLIASQSNAEVGDVVYKYEDKIVIRASDAFIKLTVRKK